MRTLVISERECEILAGARDGLANKEIVRKLGIRPKTVQQHLYHIFMRMGVENRTGAVVQAIKQGLIPLE